MRALEHAVRARQTVFTYELLSSHAERKTKEKERIARRRFPVAHEA